MSGTPVERLAEAFGLLSEAEREHFFRSLVVQRKARQSVKTAPRFHPRARSVAVIQCDIEWVGEE